MERMDAWLQFAEKVEKYTNVAFTFVYAAWVRYKVTGELKRIDQATDMEWLQFAHWIPVEEAESWHKMTELYENYKQLIK